MYRKLSVIVLFAVVFASFFVSYAVAPTVEDYVYSISSDVSPMALPSNANDYRFNQSTGKWQVKYNNLSGWGDVPNYFYLNDVLNAWGVATTADLMTSADMFSVLQKYFSDNTTFEFDTVSGNSSLSFAKIIHSLWPSSNFTYSYRLDQQNNNDVPVVVSSFPQLLGNFINYFGRATMTAAGTPFLDAAGVLQNTNGSQAYLRTVTMGIAGIGNLLGGGNNSNGHSYLLDIRNNISQLNSDLFPDSLTPFGIFPVGYPGSDPGVSRGNLALYLGDYLSAIQRPLISQFDYLDTDGLTHANYDQLNVGLTDITAHGFLGLASILRGPDEPFAQEYTMIDYSDLSTSTVTVDNILDAILWPLTDIQHDLADFMYSHGTDLDIQERKNMEEQAEQFVDDFTAPGGNGTPTTGQISDTAGVSSGIKDIFSGSSTPSDAFSQITNSDNYSFLSSQTQSELNPFYNSRSRSSDVVDFVSPKLQEIYTGVGSSW